jgi:branched-chain amino acid transport system ATP-binding protein
MTAPALAVDRLVKNFGGLRATDAVSFEVAHGGFTAIVGPNGSGKTTLLNLVTNLYRPDSGAVHLYGTSIVGLTPGRIAALGLVRTFQAARVFPGMTVRENALAGAHLHLRSPAWQQMLRLPRARAEERALAAKADALLELVGLADRLDAAATDLPMGSQKLLEVVRALMARPRLLLLDEPAAGLNDSETAELAELLGAVRDTGTTLLVVEHNMALVMGMADQVVVLDAGSVIARGTPAEIQKDSRVVEAYLGREEQAR